MVFIINLFVTAYQAYLLVAASGVSDDSDDSEVKH
jgi:hypothetical protein